MEKFDIIVIGAGHAGIEAACSSAKMGNKTLVLTLSLDSIGFLPCNPSIGGTAKGHLVCEIDALGGVMGILADKASIQRRMLNSSKGPAVHSLRAQVDKNKYHIYAKQMLEQDDNIFIKQAEASELIVKDGKFCGVRTLQGQEYFADACIVASGTYLKSRILAGTYTKNCGPNGFLRSEDLSDSLSNENISIKRFKTGTPARINGKDIDFSKMLVQKGEDDIQNFSFLTEKGAENVADCYLTYTNANTHNIIKQNINKSAMYSGLIKGTGPRYCPSIEDKIVRFADKEKHQIFLEREGLDTNEYYVQGVSTSLPVDVQKQMYASIEGLENAQVMRDAYAIEYDLIESTDLELWLEHKKVKNLFFAGQINGTSGYEEAAAQGLIAGINANNAIKNKEKFILKRNEAYIGVLIDDLITKGTNEPYRMMTSRAEYRLTLRQDNADFRLTQKGYEVGLVDEKRLNKFLQKQKNIEEILALTKTKVFIDQRLEKLCEENCESMFKTNTNIETLLKRTNFDIFKINSVYGIFDNFDRQELAAANTIIKFSGYIENEREDIEKFKRQESLEIPENFDYSNLKGLKKESIEKLCKIRPKNIGQASRISGVSPACISILIMYVKTFKKD